MIDHWLAAVPPVALYVTVFLVVGVESLGIPLPGEIVLITAALLASRDHADVWWVGAAGVAGAVLGDSIGYGIGHRWGDRLFAWMGRRFPRHAGPTHIAVARRSFDRYGVWAVFVGRFVALLRIFAGPLAGSLRMPYRAFLVANAAGGIVWAGGVTALVHTLGIVAKPWIDRFSYAALGVAVVMGIGVAVVVRRRTARHVAAVDPVPEPTPDRAPVREPVPDPDVAG